MKTNIRGFIMGIVLVFFSGGVLHAADKSVKVLGDRQLDAIRGGICFFWTCEGGEGTGSCQPIQDDAATMCSEVTCRLELDSADGVDIVECKTTNEVSTCSEAQTYMQCIRSNLPTLCFPDPNAAGGCGYQVDAGCFPDIPHRVCYCDTFEGTASCDWQSCLF